jgi:hypothetical protein
LKSRYRHDHSGRNMLASAERDGRAGSVHPTGEFIPGLFTKTRFPPW